jgi:hypothetical protein
MEKQLSWVGNEGGGGSDSFENEVTWKPEGPDQIEGTLVAKTTINLPESKGGPTVLIKIQGKDVVHVVWCSRQGLRKLVEQYDDELTIGREIGIRALEMVKTKNGNTFVPYEIGFGGVSQAVLAAVGANKGIVDDEDEPF